MSAKPLSAQDHETRAFEVTAARKFHRMFTAPATDTRGPLKVTYAIAGIEEGDVPTILFCGGMFGTRWQAVWADYLAEQEGVRVLHIDRFVYPSPLIHRLPWLP